MVNESYTSFLNDIFELLERLLRERNRQSLTDLGIVLDIDETLIHTFDNSKAFKTLNIMADPKKIDLRSRIYLLNIDTDKGDSPEVTFWGIKRPYMKEFIRFCFLYFRIVTVFSAGVYDYVHSAVEEIFKDSFEPHAILSRSNCVGSTLKLEKPFWKMVKDVPGLDKYMVYDKSGGPNDIKNMMIIDDRRTSFAQNPDNGINIPVYEPSQNEDSLRKNDICLLQIMNWLMRPEVINCDDVRKLDKNIIFNTHFNSIPTAKNNIPLVNQYRGELIKVQA